MPRASLLSLGAPTTTTSSWTETEAPKVMYEIGHAGLRIACSAQLATAPTKTYAEPAMVDATDAFAAPITTVWFEIATADPKRAYDVGFEALRTAASDQTPPVVVASCRTKTYAAPC